MLYRERIKRSKKRSLDVVVRAVATGIFLASLSLNVVFLVLVLILAAAAGAVKDRGLEQSRYRKVFHRDSSSSSSSYARTAGNELAVVRISGVISEYGADAGLFGYGEDSVSAVLNRLSMIKRDESVKGVLLLIESPGGTVTASDVIYHAVREFKEETGTPVVTMMKGMATSGAYYVAAASDYIVAYPTTITGSIGVILYSFNFKGLMDKYGVKYVAVKTGEFKDMMSPFKGINGAELAYMQTIVDRMLEQFVSAVAGGRKNLSVERVKKLADGRIYIAEDAVALGLIDATGYFKDAVEALAERAGIAAPIVVEFESQRGIMSYFKAAAARLKPRSFFDRPVSDLAPFFGRAAPDGSMPAPGDTAGLYYMWEGSAFPR
jgi:protease-4